MSLVTAAKNQIKRYGFKGAAKLKPLLSKAEDLNSLTITPTFGAKVDLNSYVGSFGPDQVNNTTVFVDDIKILATPDQDWNGIINEGDKIEIDSKTYDIIRSKTQKVKAVIAYVEIQVRG